MPTLRLSDTAISIWEVDLADETEDELRMLGHDDQAIRGRLLLQRARHGSTLHLPTDATDRNLMADAVSDMANAFDDLIELHPRDGEDLAFNSRARSVMTNLSRKLRTAP